MLRFLWLNSFIAIYSFVFCILAILLSLFGGNGRKSHFYAAVPWARSILWVSGIKVKVSGRENADPHVPRIYMTNHQSYFDILGMLASLPVDFKFVVKQELMRIPFFGRAMRGAGYIGLEREDPRKAVRSMNEAAEKIKHGSSMVIYPEGTRSEDGRLLPFKRGGFKLALKSGCDIVPVAISNSYRIVPKGRLMINKGSFHIHIGKPVSVNDYNRKNINLLMDRVRDAILDKMD